MTHFDDKAAVWDRDPQKIIRADKVAEAIRRLVPLDRRMTALEYGCGTGLLGFALQESLGEVVLADSSPGMLAIVEQKITAAGVDHVSALPLDLSVDPLPARQFDLICSLMTLHHVSDYQALLSQFNRLLNPSGYLCIADLDAEDGSFHGDDFSGHRGFDRAELTGALERIGFEQISFMTVFEVVRGDIAEPKHYPVFLMLGRKS